jgi:membrane protein
MFKFIQEIINEFSTDRGFLFAAAISFFGLISVIPLILLAVGIFGWIVGSRDDALQSVLSFLAGFLPVESGVLEAYLQALSSESRVLSWIGFAGLLWSGMQVFVILQQVMNVALGTAKKLGFFRTRSMAILLVLVAGALFVISIGITSAVAAARHYHPAILGIKIGTLDVLWRFVGTLVPMFISTLAFTFIYKYAPTEDIGTRGPVVGGVTAGVLFEVAKAAFRLYFTRVANFHLVYGSLGSVIMLVLWVYYASAITVLGAEVTSVYVRVFGVSSSGSESPLLEKSG